MILTVTNFCQNIGKSTLVIYLSKYFLKHRNFDEVYIIDNGSDLLLENLFHSEKEKINLNILMDSVSDEKINILNNIMILSKLKEQKTLYLVDLRADFKGDMVNLIKHSNAIISPFAYYDNILSSTIEFGKFLENFYDGNVYFLNNFFDKNISCDQNLIYTLSSFGSIIESPIFFTNNLKRSFLSVYNDELVFRKAFEELSFSLFD
ncbi:hypothetical protein NZD88_20710 [Chryseobacterium antibioticum]|uniref:AAA domain-containing protein n=1 Tax=Chryseobacterium pyrolae TaxID=2987481 RepID=A0ABT2IMU2_9FLAO|nr:hypothetical protein [Chryseobacterium pyrolae]MCT2409984.1 hypothetical protein [Chryseobacterium pyrolae]